MTGTDIQRGVTKFDATVPVQYYEFAPLAERSNDDQRSAFVREMVAPGANDAEWATFVGVCNAFRLNPLMNPRPVWCIERRENVNGQWVTSHPPQLGIAAYRIFAARSGEYGGGTETQWCGDDGNWRSVWIPTIRADARGNRQPVYPTAARVGVWRTGFREPQWGVALWSEYAEYKKDGSAPRSLWAKYPAFMLAKCAEKQALVKAFPEQIPEAKVGRYFSISEAPGMQAAYRPALSERQAAGAGLLYPQDEPEEGEYQEQPEPTAQAPKRQPPSDINGPHRPIDPDTGLPALGVKDTPGDRGNPMEFWALTRVGKTAERAISDADLERLFDGPPSKWIERNGNTWQEAAERLRQFLAARSGERQEPVPPADPDAPASEEGELLGFDDDGAPIRTLPFETGDAEQAELMPVAAAIPLASKQRGAH